MVPTRFPAREDNAPDRVGASFFRKENAERRQFRPAKAHDAASFSHSAREAISPPLSRHRTTGIADPKVASRAVPVNGKPKEVIWTVETMKEQMLGLFKEVERVHCLVAAHAIESTRPSRQIIEVGEDLFAGLSSEPVATEPGKAMKLKFKQHIKNRKDNREEYHRVTPIKTDKDRVPPYMFHHKNIKKNILTPNTMLSFVPHLRDLEADEEARYNKWLEALEGLDMISGFNPKNREEKHAQAMQYERARTLSLFWRRWLDVMSIPQCTEQALKDFIRQEMVESYNRRQSREMPSLQEMQSNLFPTNMTPVQMFAAAFRDCFEKGRSPSEQIKLRDVLFLDPSVLIPTETKPAVKDGPNCYAGDEFDLAESNTYIALGCLICFSHSCEHGDYDSQNNRRAYAITSARVRDYLEKRKSQSSSVGYTSLTSTPGDQPKQRCFRKCYQTFPTHTRNNLNLSDDEVYLVRSISVSADSSKIGMDPVCLAAELLNRDCRDVYVILRSVVQASPAKVLASPRTPEKRRTPNLAWYDRSKKLLLGDWQDHIRTQEFSRKDLIEPCMHAGPCSSQNCGCVKAGLLCERFCACNVETCAWKFDGCACHSLGKTCQKKQGDKQCICIQLNRECDPDLCEPCGAFERADSRRARDDILHATGCQNCQLQRGVSQPLMLGKSQLGFMYGLYAADDISHDQFVIEYVGELIIHDEGERREARRGDEFVERSTASYVFTLLEQEGIWVDAAIYGNLSRYVNHAPERNVENPKLKSNVTPQVLYVNGEYRIKFIATRDIRRGEELFFNYGQHFPNLNSKLLRNKAETNGNAAKKPRQQRRGRPAAVMGKKSKALAKKHQIEKVKSKQRAGRKRKQQHDQELEEENQNNEVGEANGDTRTEMVEAEAEEEEDGRGGEDDNTYTEFADQSRMPMNESTLKVDGQVETRSRKRPRKGSLVNRTGLLGETQPVTKGKRGGARKGSGRPRKHPRPVTEPNNTSGKEKATSFATTATMKAVPYPTMNRLPNHNSEEDHRMKDASPECIPDSEDERERTQGDTSLYTQYSPSDRRLDRTPRNRKPSIRMRESQ